MLFHIMNTHYRISSLSNNKCCQLIFLDLAKAVDFVDRSKLLEQFYIICVKKNHHIIGLRVTYRGGGN